MTATVGVANAVNLLDLDCVVVGGGVAQKLGQPVVDRIAAAARPFLLVPDAPRRFAVAGLGDAAGVVGQPPSQGRNGLERVWHEAADQAPLAVHGNAADLRWGWVSKPERGSGRHRGDGPRERRDQHGAPCR